jgi:hypothetical protein
MSTINTEIEKLSTWLQSNRLSINLKKTNFILFKPRQRKLTRDFVLEINKSRVDRVSEVVFVGVVLDECLSWKPHDISLISNKISKSVGIIFKASFCLSKAALRILYFSLVYPYLQYCVIFCGSTYPANLDRVVKLQKRVVRCICRQPYDAHTDPLFKELKILKFGDIYLFNLCMFMFSYNNDLLPDPFRNFFQPVNRIHQYNTRNSGLLYIPFCRTNIRRFSVFYQGLKFFNKLSSDIRSTFSIASFRNKFKKYLLSFV